MRSALAADAGKKSRLSVFVQNRAGRRGVPLRASFQHWIAAIPDLPRSPRGRPLEVNLRIVDEAEGRDFNHRFRGKAYATNVLSFPYQPMPHETTGLLGDLVLCAPVIAREAVEHDKPLRDHYAHLVIHGVLHLLGHDHENARDAECMETLERRILASLGIADPYA